MRSWRSAAAILAFGTCLSGCASTMPSDKVAVGYNRIFAKSRDEALLVNILRASAREPLQFSTMGTVTGGVSPTGEVTLPFSNILSKDGLKLTLKDEINPAVTIVPLADKDFTTGILNPVSLDTLNYFLNQGWDPELLLTLTVGGVICDNGDTKKLVLNRGIPTGGYEVFKEMFSRSPGLPIQAAGKPDKQVLRLAAKDAVPLFKSDALAGGWKIDSVEPLKSEKGEPTGTVDVTLTRAADEQLVGLDPTEVCKLPGATVLTPVESLRGAYPAISNAAAPTLDDTANAPAETAHPTNAKGPSSKVPAPRPATRSNPKYYVLLRSVESIIYFLGETQRYRFAHTNCGPTSPTTDNWPDYVRRRPVFADKLAPTPTEQKQDIIVFRVQRVCGNNPIAPPFRTFVQTNFNGQFYYVLRSSDVDPAPDETPTIEPRDRTLTTLTFLDELIALQTNPASITSSAPLVTVGAQ